MHDINTWVGETVWKAIVRKQGWLLNVEEVGEGSAADFSGAAERLKSCITKNGETTSLSKLAQRVLWQKFCVRYVPTLCNML